MSRPWSLSRKVLVVAPFVTPKIVAPNLHPLLSRIDEEDYAILTTVEGIPEGVAAGRPWLAGRYCFCDDPSATRQTAALPRRPTMSTGLRAGIVRVATRLHARRLLRRLAAPMLVFTRTARFVRGGLRAVAQARCELLLGVSDNGPAIIATYLVARMTRTPYVYYLLDLYRGNRFPWSARWLARLLERRMFTGAECVVTSNAATAQYYRTRYADRVRLDVVHIVTADDAYASEPPAYDPRPPYVISYTGAVYWAQWQAVANGIRAMDLLRDLPVQLRIYCQFPPPELTDMAAGRANVWLGRARSSEMPRIQREATLLLVALGWRTGAPDIVATATPGKSVEYLASGRPMLVHAPEYAYISRHAKKHRLGLVVDEDDPAALARAVRAFLRAPEVGREYVANAREMYRRRHDPDAAAERFVSILNGKHA
jgi:glycosyltransferase involved in cell wall biosynthesis